MAWETPLSFVLGVMLAVYMFAREEKRLDGMPAILRVRIDLIIGVVFLAIGLIWLRSPSPHRANQLVGAHLIFVIGVAALASWAHALGVWRGEALRLRAARAGDAIRSAQYLARGAWIPLEDFDEMEAFIIRQASRSEIAALRRVLQPSEQHLWPGITPAAMRGVLVRRAAELFEVNRNRQLGRPAGPP